MEAHNEQFRTKGGWVSAPRERARRPGVPMTCADVDKVRARVGFEPATPLGFGLGRFAEWFRSRKATAPSA